MGILLCVGVLAVIGVVFYGMVSAAKDMASMMNDENHCSEADYDLASKLDARKN